MYEYNIVIETYAERVKSDFNNMAYFASHIICSGLGQLKRIPTLQAVYSRLKFQEKKPAVLSGEKIPYVEPPNPTLPIGEQRKIYFQRLREAQAKANSDA